MAWFLPIILQICCKLANVANVAIYYDYTDKAHNYETGLLCQSLAVNRFSEMLWFVLFAAGSVVMQIKGKDKDQPGTINSEISYRIVSQEPAGTGQMFTLDRKTGQLYVKEENLDREVRLLVIVYQTHLTYVAAPFKRIILNTEWLQGGAAFFQLEGCGFDPSPCTQHVDVSYPKILYPSCSQRQSQCCVNVCECLLTTLYD